MTDQVASVHQVSEADVAAAMVYRPELLNGAAGDLVAAPLFGQPVLRAVAASWLGGARGEKEVFDRLRGDGYPDDRIVEELAGLKEVADLIRPEHVHQAVEFMTRPDTVDRRLAALPRTDLGNAQRLVARHGRDLRYVRPWRRWLIWDGRRWAEDATGEVHRRAKHAVRRIYVEAAVVDDARERKELSDWAQKCEGEPRIAAILELAWSEPGVPVTPGQLDADPWAINVANGVIDLRRGELQPHDPNGLHTKLAPVDFDPAAPCPMFERFLEETTCCRRLIRRYLLQLLGLALTGDIREQILPVFYGIGSNGKSVLIDSILAIMGDYGGKAAPELLVAKKWSDHPTEIADLCGKRLVVASETEKGQRLRVQFVKEITGDRTMKGRRMRQDFFEFSRTNKTILVTNNKPRVDEQTNAIWRRVQLVPFENVVPPERQNKDLVEKLISTEAPGIMALLVRGCLDWQANGLIVPAEVEAATTAYKAESDSVGQFIAECLEIRPGAWTASKTLAEAFETWCGENGVKPPMDDLRSRLRDKGCTPQHTNQGRGWSGVSTS